MNTIKEINDAYLLNLKRNMIKTRISSLKGMLAEIEPELHEAELQLEELEGQTINVGDEEHNDIQAIPQDKQASVEEREEIL